MSGALHELTIARAAELVRARTLSPVELTEALLARISALDSQVNAFITLTAELALEQARAAEADIAAGRWRGPLHGVPFALKDVYNTAGILTSAHSRIGARHVPAQDATVTAKLKAAGAVLLGKLATYQFTHGGPAFELPWPPARNPWNLAHDAGGSSSGSAAAVAAAFVPMAMGSDTGGSVRIPASFCGVAGLKPTHGLVSRAGVVPNSYTFDHCGPLARSVEDCAIVLNAIAGFDAGDPGSTQVPRRDYAAALATNLKGVRVGVLRHFWEEDIPASPEIAQAMEEAIRVLRSLGAEIADARMRPLQEYYDVKNVITKSEIFCVHQRDMGERALEFGRDFLGTTLGGSLFQATDYVQARREHRRMIAELEPLYERFDVLVTFNAGPASRMKRNAPLEFWNAKTSASTICIPFNVSGGPALSVCNGFNAAGLPLAMQIAGRPFDDAAVLRVGHAYERATAWHERRPPLDAGAAPLQAPDAVPHVPSTDFDDGDADYIGWLAARAALQPDAGQLEQLHALMPYADAMARRVHEMGKK